MAIDVLLVDDQQEKLEAIIRTLGLAGIDRRQVDAAMTGADARARLREKKYDLMILDLAIPRRPEEAASADGGIELLDEMFERGNYQLPGHVLTVTAREDVAERFAEKLDDRLIHLIRYDATTDKWQRQISAFVADLLKMSAARAPVRFDQDVCLVTATRAPELRAVRDLELDVDFGPARHLDSGTPYYAGGIKVDGVLRSVVASACPRMGPVAAAAHVTRLIEAFRPRLIAMTGICAGVRDGTEIGDVIVAAPAWDWQSGKRVVNRTGGKSGAFRIDPHYVDVEARVSAAFEELAESVEALPRIYAGWRGDKPRNLPRILVGPVASGASVVADGESIEEIKKTQHRKLLGLDMESYAVYAACLYACDPRPLWLSAKAVCDHGDSKKSDDYQAYAARVSAEAVVEVVKRFGGRFL